MCSSTKRRAGCGLNVTSPAPVASLASLLPLGEEHTLGMERIMATIMAKFEAMWNVCLANKGSFEPFMDLYLDRWLHSYVRHLCRDLRAHLAAPRFRVAFCTPLRFFQ